MHAIMTKIEKHYRYYKGERYCRCILHFKLWFFRWSIIYDLTCFDDWKTHFEFWEGLITNKSKIKLSAIKARDIF